MFDPIFSESRSRIDRLQIAAIFALMIIGVLFVYSATMVTDSALSAPFYRQKWLLQLVWYVGGTCVAVALCFFNYQTLARWGTVAFWCGVLLLALVLIFGTVRFGARRWFDLKLFMLQPSEFAKLAFILGFANYLSRPETELASPATFLKALGMILVPFLLILKEPDLGSALVLLPTGLAMLFAAGTPKRYLATLIGGVGLLAALFIVDVLWAPPGWWQIKLENYQRQRLLVYFGVDFARPGASPAEKAEARRFQ
jgi:rod shape determining protein RodA